jgi:hypothetical protein
MERMSSGCLPRFAPPSLALALLLLSLVAPGTVLAAAAFPPGFEGYHTYAEVKADILAVEAAHPGIVDVFTYGQSYLGRDLLAAKVSDNVGTDENEPEVLFDGGIHADEHMGVEMTLKIFHWLVGGYGSDQRLTDIVDGREVWILFQVNPDGATHDIAGGEFHYWRKNRQPTPGSSSVGTDLNRNFGYRWGGGGRTSSNPAAITFRGTKAFSTPEARAFRDFLAGRVIGGRQQIKAGISFHETGRLVMWPYGYTKTDLPSDMTEQDRVALVRMGKAMAATNGYTPEQASDLYISSGTSRDFEYGTYRIFAYTFELSNKDYLPDTRINAETGRNKAAVLYLLEHAACPWSVVSDAVATARCGAFDDDLEVKRGWTVDPDGTDTAPANARFDRANPSGTASSGVKQRTDTPSGAQAFVTGRLAGSTATANDLDGTTTIRSPSVTLPAGAGQRWTFKYVFAHDAKGSAADSLRAIVEVGGVKTVVFERLGTPVDVDGVWRSVSIPMDAYAGQTVRLRFEAREAGVGNLVEVELDDVRITRGS